MGGTFDPVHNGHLMVASYLCRCGSFDQVWMVVSPHNPLKAGEAEVSDRDRLQMLEIATAGDSRVRPCDIELNLTPPYYTISTLRQLKALYPDCRFRLVVGADNWQIFDRWYCCDEIIREFGVTVYPRPGYPSPQPSQLPANVDTIDAPQIELSSTFIRSSLAEGRSMRYFLPDGVMRHIALHNLYGFRPDTENQNLPTC